MTQSLISALIQMIVLVKLNHNVITSSCATILTVTFISTILVVIVTAFEIVFQARSSKRILSTTNDLTSNNNEMEMAAVRIPDEYTTPINEVVGVIVVEENINPITSNDITAVRISTTSETTTRVSDNR